MKISDIGFTVNNSRAVRESSMCIDELSESVKKNGLIAPIVIYKNNEGGKEYSIIAGQRRFLALKKLRGDNGSLTQGEYVIREADLPKGEHKEVDILEVSIVENQFRQALSPLDLNRAALKLNQKGNYSDKEIAKILNITPHRLKRIEKLGMDLTKMTPEIREELSKSGEDAKFNDAHWDKMRDIEDPDTMKDVFDHIMEKELPPRDLPSLIKSVQKANDEAYGTYDDEDGKGVGSSPEPEDEEAGGPIKYKHKGEIFMEESDGKKVFRVEGKGEDGDIPLEHYMEYLSRPDKFKCKIDLKLTIIPLD